MDKIRITNRIGELAYAKARCLASCRYIRDLNLRGISGYSTLARSNFSMAETYEHQIQMLEIEMALIEVKNWRVR